MILFILLYLFAVIGVLVTAFAAYVFIGLSFSKWVAKSELERRARQALVDSLTKAHS